MPLETKRFSHGAFTVRKAEAPRRRHVLFLDAEDEARRLAAATGHTFIIDQEVGSVKVNRNG